MNVHGVTEHTLGDSRYQGATRMLASYYIHHVCKPGVAVYSIQSTAIYRRVGELCLQNWLPSYHSMTMMTKCQAAAADAACCGRLQAIDYTSDQPVVIIDVASPINRTEQDGQFCVCSNGLAGAMLAGNCTMERKGGPTSSRLSVWQLGSAPD